MTNNENLPLLVFVIVLGFIFILITFHNADAQILPFEQQLEAIRDPQDCTRKVVQASSAQVPFTMKVFYDTTRNAVLEIKQQGNTFPLTQRTNQVMTFYTNGTDQYEIYMEMNYDDAKPRQVYMEYLSQNLVTFSGQEKFDGTKFCMRIFVNTVLPPREPTKEEIFGEALDYIAQIPAMVTAFNANSVTTATNISFQWLLIVGLGVAIIIIFINSIAGSRSHKAMIKDGYDVIGMVSTSADKIDKLEKTAIEFIDALKLHIDSKGLQKVEEKKKHGFFKKPHIEKPKTSMFSRWSRKKKEENKIIPKELPNIEKIDEEIIEELEAKEMEQEMQTASAKIIEEQPEKKTVQIKLEDHPDYELKEQPLRFMELIKSIDYVKKEFKGDLANLFTYKELNMMYGWITHYRKHMNLLGFEIPKKFLQQQDVIIDVVYREIINKLNKRLSND